MAIIANATTSNLSFDKTVECEVTNADKRDEGRYTVKSDEAQFEAFATADKTYYVHDIVYVTVPGGDFSRQKFIVGRKTDDNDASTVYNLKFPFDDFVKLMKVDMTLHNEPWGFWANKEEDDRMISSPRGPILIGESILTSPVTGLTSLGIQADVSCFLASYYPRMGSYGLQIDITGTIKPSDEHEAFDTERSYTFMNSEMYGNSYAYYQGYQQQKVLDVSTFQSISAIRVYFIQEYNFFDDANQYIPVSDNANIFFDNLEIYLGMTNDQLDDEQLFLYTYDSIYFKTIDVGSENELEQREEFLKDNEKVINFQWVHIKDDKSGTILFSKPQDIEDFNDALWAEICGDKVIDDTNAPERIAYNNRELHVYWYEEDLSMSADGTALEVALGKSYGGPRWRQLTFDTKLANGENGFAYKYYPSLEIQTNADGQEIESEEQAKKRQAEYFTGFELKTDVGCKLAKRRFKVLVVFGNNKHSSNILTFSNFDTADSGHSQGVTDNADMILKSFVGYYDEENNYYIKEDKSGIVGRFYVYDENDNALMDTFGRKYSEIDYYVQVWRKNPDGTASYIPLFGNELDFTVTWDFETDYTMIDHYIGRDTLYSLSIQDIKAFAFLQVLDGVETLPNNPHTAFDECHEDIQILLKTTQKFRIKPKLMDQYRRNDITAIVSEEHINYYAHKNFQFGQMGSQGSSYTASIVIESSEAMNATGDVLGTYADAYILNDSNFILRCDVYDPDNQLITGIEGYTFTWELLNPDECKISSPRDDGKTADGPYFYGHYNAGASTQAPAFKVTIKGVCEWDLIAKRGFLTAPLLRQYNIFVPDRIEYKSDGTVPYYYQNYFTIEKIELIDGALKKTFLYPDWSLIGPERIQLIEKDVPQASVELAYQEEACITVNDHKEYSLLVGKEHETHAWFEKFDAETIHLSTSINNTPVRQAIVQDQNVYASSLVNTWDGTTLTLDSSTGSILANRIATGTKSNNKFTGVMMGDWNPYGDRSLDITGIYGFQDGQQSFGFMKDGTGFIGTAGSGQIKFDGRTAMISSSILSENNQPRCYINLNPATIEFEKNADGSIKLTNGKPTIKTVPDESTNTSPSQYFLYCEIPRANEAQDELQKSWINTFKGKADSNYDYFIVDPNRGMMTTGGIIGKYGYIGDWLLDRGGLSWYSDEKDNNENNPLLTEKKFYDTIYLGNEERNPYTNVIKDNVTHKYGENQIYKYLISAGKLNEGTYTGTNTGDMNFGVTADGHLFSKSGLIGGWHITDKAFYSGERRDSVSDDEYLDKHHILLDAENKVISFNDRNIVIDGTNAKQQFFAIKDSNGNITVDENGNPVYAILIDGQNGIISLCNGVITLDGATGTATFGKMNGNTMNGTINLAGYYLLGEVTEESINAGQYSEGTSTQDTTNAGSYGDAEVGELTSFTYDTYSSNNIEYQYKILNNWKVLQDKTYGIQLSTGEVTEEAGTVNTKSVFFCPSGKDLLISALGTKTNPWDLGFFNTALYVNNQLVVTHPQLDEIANKIWKKIKEVNNLATKAYKAARAAAAKAQEAADTANEALELTVVGGTFGMSSYQKILKLIKKNGDVIELDPVPGLIHSHKFTTFEFSESGGKISLTLDLGTAESEQGAVTKTFNIAATKYHMDQIAAAYKAGYKAGFNQCATDTVYEASTYTASSDVHSHSYKKSSHTVHADGTCTYTESSDSHSHTYTPSTYSASTFTAATEKTPTSGWESYY